ncbi:MAG TPA: hypothetical protein VEA59_04935 [Patescibacteria group bacterium]|nr:hypothetical protein [Patescibacteria group bacterium]
MFSSVKSHYFAFILGTLLSLASLASTVWYLHPVKNSIALPAYYLSLFLFFTGFGIIFGLTVRRAFFEGTYIKHLTASVRQGVFLGLLAVITFLLLSNRLFHWWVFLILVFIFFIIEFLLS